MEHSSRQTIISLQKNMAPLMASFSVNEYETLVFNEMQLRPHFAIVVEDFNMGKIVGKKSYISGKIRHEEGTKGRIIDFDVDNSNQTKQLETCCYSEKEEIRSAMGEKLGTVVVYSSNHRMEKELNEIITGTVINAIAISASLILLLLFTIRYFILKPISNIISVISHPDDDGIPLELINGHGSTEIRALSDSMNNMISTIRTSRIKLTEQHNELKTREDQLQTLSMATEQSPVSILVCSPDNIIEYANPQCEKTTGCTANEAVGQPVEFLFQHNEQDNHQLTELKQSLASGKLWMGEISALTKEGEHYYLRMSASPVLLEDGTVTHNIYVAEDITAQKQNEEILRTSQKMDAVGQLTGGIAHDFNNLMGIITGNLELLKEMIGDQPTLLKRVDKALAGTVRGTQLTRKLLNFSRQDHSGQELTQINPFIKSLRELIAKSVTAAIQVETHLAENLWPINIVPGDLEDAILNLSLNARDAMLTGGLLVIETANKHLDTNFIQHAPNLSEGDYVMISVSDTGNGIAKEVRKKIFDPFFTTKEQGKGTGLGLSMVYGFVQRSSGHIHFYSELGQGSTFHIYLPRATDVQRTQPDSEQIKAPRGDETILIVDDEEALVEIAEEYLHHLGYRTRVAKSAEQALEILSTTDGIDLIFSDVVMPNVDGFNLAFLALKQQPKIRILLTSGFTPKRMEFINGERKIYLKLSKKLLGKPYNLNELALAVRRTLGEQ